MKSTLTTIVTLALVSLAKAVPTAAPTGGLLASQPQRPSIISPQGSTHINDPDRPADISHLVTFSNEARALSSKSDFDSSYRDGDDTNEMIRHSPTYSGPRDMTASSSSHDLPHSPKNKHHVKNQTESQPKSDIPERSDTRRNPGNSPTPLLNIRSEDDNDVTDIQYLNFALTLKQFQHAFYTQTLSRLSGDDFRNAGYPDWVRQRFTEIADNERVHKEFLESAIAAAGSDHVQSANYDFRDDGVQSFVDTSMAIETIAASAFIGLLQLLNNKAYVTAGASVLAGGARQAAWINSSVRKQNAWNAGFETPLTPKQVFTLLSDFFNYETLSKSNQGLLPANLHSYPPLTLSPRLVPGQQAEISFPYTAPTSDADREILRVAFLTGPETIFSLVLEREQPGLEDGQGLKRYFVEIPMDLARKGVVYVLVLRGRNPDMSDISLEDDNVIAGPAIAMFPFDARAATI